MTHQTEEISLRPRQCRLQPLIDQLRETLQCRAAGKDRCHRTGLVVLLARGHLLFDDLPGLGKTTLAKAIAYAVGGRYARMQCTPDLLPSDITGFNIFNQRSREFEFSEGPVFSDVLLADEINRATPRTQSALFEAMAERQVTIDNKCRQLAHTFFVIATQNPVESHGAYPLPEAQLDRFAMKLRIGYPNRSSEVEMLATNIGPATQARELVQVMHPSDLLELQNHVAQLAVTRPVREYLVDLGEATRQHRLVQLGVSLRGLITWQRVAQAWAHLRGRDFVTPDDVREVAGPVLSVRLTGEFESAEQVVQDILSAVPVPVISAME